jgi:hypothetical protein
MRPDIVDRTDNTDADNESQRFCDYKGLATFLVFTNMIVCITIAIGGCCVACCAKGPGPQELGRYDPDMAAPHGGAINPTPTQEYTETDIALNFTASAYPTTCICIPKGEEMLRITPTFVTVKRSAGVCNLSFLSSWSSTNFELKTVAYLKVLSDQAVFDPTIMMTALAALVSRVLVYLSQGYATIVGGGLIGIWVVFFLAWVFFRSSYVVFGTSQSGLRHTWIGLSLCDQQ